MAISFIGSGAGNGGTTSIAPPYPASLVAGDLLVLAVTNKYPNNGPDTPAGWTAGAQQFGGHGSAGADAGNVFSTLFWKISDGTETGNLTVTLPSSNSATGRIFQFRKNPEAGWADPVFLQVAQGTPDTAWSVSPTASQNFRVGDMVIVLSSYNADNLTCSAQAITFLSAVTAGQQVPTVANETERLDGFTNQGDDCAHTLSTHEITAGNYTGRITFSMTVSGSATDSPAGASLFMRLREVGPPAVTARTRGRGRVRIVVRNRRSSRAELQEHRADELKKQVRRARGY